MIQAVSYPFFWHEIGSANDFVTIWNNIVDTAQVFLPTLLMNQGVPDPSIGQVGGQPAGTTCWHAVCYGTPSTVVGNIQPVAFHAWGTGALPAIITKQIGRIGVFRLTDGVFFNIFQLPQKGF